MKNTSGNMILPETSVAHPALDAYSEKGYFDSTI
jgi:hypothetical protein